MGEPARFEELVERLSDGRASVRRVAVIDLDRLARREAALSEPAYAAMLERLLREPDARTAIAIVRRLREARYTPAMEALLRLYEAAATPAELAVEAIRAHDAIASAGGR